MQPLATNDASHQTDAGSPQAFQGCDQNFLGLESSEVIVAVNWAKNQDTNVICLRVASDQWLVARTDGNGGKIRLFPFCWPLSTGLCPLMATPASELR